MAEPDLDGARDCATEPIHIPGSIMPFGMLIALRQDGDGYVLERASANAGAVLTGPVEDCLSRSHSEVLSAEALASFGSGLDALGPFPGELPPIDLGGRSHPVTAHRSGEEIVIEIEAPPGGAMARTESLYDEVRGLVEAFHSLDSVDAMGRQAAETVQRITGMDRVLVYRFEPNWDGVVVAEVRNDRLPSYLGLRFPASDIPSQARALYRANRFRQIPDATYAAVPVLARAGLTTPLDLSQSILRSVSPVHLQYMRNMGTAASMSISVIVDGELWGLISGHHAEPLRVPPPARAACDLVGQLLAMGMAGHLRYADAADRVARQRILAHLLAAMASRPRFMDGLLLVGDELVSLVAADGAAVLSDGGCIRLGQTPEEPVIRRIAAWLAQRGEDSAFATDALPELFPNLGDAAPLASGLLAVSISQIHPSYVLWFRAEFVRSVHWAGDPRKDPHGEVGPTGRLNPRRSFQTWMETVRLKSRPWKEADVEAGRDLRSAIVNIVLRRAEQMADISRELERSNKELEAFSYSISHDLRAPFRHIVGYAELLREREFGRMDDTSKRFVDTIIDSAFSAGKLVDDLLRFSQMGRMTIQRIPVSTAKIVEEVVRSLEPDVGDRPLEWHIGEMPPVHGDPNLLRQVFLNLLSNAVKYSRGREPAIVTVRAQREGDEIAFAVSDNGVGFDMAYAGKLFGVFQRLHRAEEFEGTGIGLANVRRIVERHGGRVTADGKLGEGATFTVYLPAPESPRP